MSRMEPAFIRSIVVFGVFFVLLELGLSAHFETQTAGEGTEFSLLLWLFLLTGFATWLGHPGSRRVLDIVVAPIQRFGLRAVAALSAIALALFLFVGGWVLDAFPNSGDELAYVLQAQTYAQGRLWVDPPPLEEAFQHFRFVVIGDKWISQYAPGWAMVLAPFAALNLPLWIVNPLIGAATLAAFFVLARRYVSNEGAWIGALLLGASSFFIFNSSSYFAHSLTALFGVAFVLFGSRYIERREIWCAIGAGACIGLMGLTRTQNAVIFALPFAAALAIRPDRRSGLLWFGLGGAPFLVALLLFNGVVTGNPLIAVQNVTGNESFGAPSLLTVTLAFHRFAELFNWTSPVLVFGFAIAFFAALRRGKIEFSDWIMPATIGAFLLYALYGGNQYGPRYYFEAWPFALLTILKTIDPILSGTKRGAGANWISSAVVASLLFAVAYVPVHLEREHNVVLERQDVYAQAESAGLTNSIVIIAGDVGTIRPMPPRDLVRNGLRIGEQNVIYALDLGAQNESLRSQFPGRSLYRYSNGRLEALP
jgi:hypothetical protein